MRIFLCAILLSLFFLSCRKQSITPKQHTPFSLISLQMDSSTTQPFYGISADPNIALNFSEPVSRSAATLDIQIRSIPGTVITSNMSFYRKDSEVILQPASPLIPITGYQLFINQALVSATNDSLSGPSVTVKFITSIDTTDKFPRISDSALLDLVEAHTFQYFYSGANPVSGMALERSTSGDIVTTGGSGFGVMAILVGIYRNFITRAQGLARISAIVSFLTNKAHTYYGAFPHWMNGNTGATIPFSTQDDGADLVETAYMMEGLLCARQFFNSPSDTGEITLRNQINALWRGVNWSYFSQGGQHTLFWHWSPDYGWESNQQINGWNEALITYVLASGDTDSINRIDYVNGWAQNGNIRNGNSYYGIPLPLGPAYGGPLFFAHYSFLGLDPHGLSDEYANYWTQDTAQTMINYAYCVANPLHYNGYGPDCWGLTASDDNFSGYSAHSPTNDLGVISPTAAISSMPYSPVQSMNALRYFYYKLGDKIWGQYGFTDAFDLTNIWFDNQYLAIDQGPEIVMIENYRSGLLWNLLMSCPEVKLGLQQLAFQSPFL